jgi:hypothetical protein
MLRQVVHIVTTGLERVKQTGSENVTWIDLGPVGGTRESGDQFSVLAKGDGLIAFQEERCSNGLLREYHAKACTYWVGREQRTPPDMY